MKKSELKKLSIEDMPPRIPGTEHIRIPYLLYVITEGHKNSPLVADATKELKNILIDDKLTSEQEKEINKILQEKGYSSQNHIEEAAQKN